MIRLARSLPVALCLRMFAMFAAAGRPWALRSNADPMGTDRTPRRGCHDFFLLNTPAGVG